MSTLSVPAAEPRPVGRVEWAAFGSTLYGVDAVGNVWVFRGGAPAARRVGYRRLVRSILAKPRHRKGL